MKRDIMQLEDYYKIVDNAAEKSEDFAIPNRDVRHASYLAKTLFHHAQQEVCIFTGSLFDEYYGRDDIKSEAANFLRKSPFTKIRVAFQVGPAGEVVSGRFLKYIMADSERKGTIELYDATKVTPSVTNHFIVSDAKAYRFELNHDEFRAEANFGNAKNAKILAGVFEAIAVRSVKIPLAC